MSSLRLYCQITIISDQKNSLENALIESEECGSVGQLKALFDWHLSFINQKNYNGCLLNKALVELWNNLNGMLLPANKNIVEWSDLEKII